MGGKVLDMTQARSTTRAGCSIDCLVCLGGGGTQKNALRLSAAGLHVVTLPKTIDNDVGRDRHTFGFDTALGIATEAIDRLHTTATSHQRPSWRDHGSHAGWLTLGSGIAGGADVVLIPEIPYDPRRVSEHLLERGRAGKRFSIIAVAEGALSVEEARPPVRTRAGPGAQGQEGRPQGRPKDGHKAAQGEGRRPRRGQGRRSRGDRSRPPQSPPRPGDRRGHRVESITHRPGAKASRLARHLQKLTGTEARVTPSAMSSAAASRPGRPPACTRLGARPLDAGRRRVQRHGRRSRRPLRARAAREVAGKTNPVPPDHPWIDTARKVGTCLGDL